MYKENSLIVPLYKPIVIPHYNIQAWSPYFMNDLGLK